MPHIHTNPGEHDLTASAFIVDISENEPRLWLHEHRLLGSWLQFGGHVELTENPWQAVCHEIEEESGFSLDQLKVLQPVLRLQKSDYLNISPQPVVINTHQFPESDHFHTDISFAFVTKESPLGMVADDESQNLRLYTRHQIDQAEPELIPPNVRQIALFVLEQLLQEWEAVDPQEFNR